MYHSSQLLDEFLLGAEKCQESLGIMQNCQKLSHFVSITSLITNWRQLAADYESWVFLMLNAVALMGDKRSLETIGHNSKKSRRGDSSQRRVGFNKNTG